MNSTNLESQQQIAEYYRLFLGDPAKLAEKQKVIQQMRNTVELIENGWNQQEESLVDVCELPTSKQEFLTWYLFHEKKINEDIRFFVEHLRYKASVKEIAYYICMEEMVDGSFDDLMAVAQLGMPIECKMVAGENYWDEMGNGDFERVHTTMFKTSSRYMKELLLNDKVKLDLPPVECLMNGNILLMWAVRREFNIRLIGAMGLVEGSAPIRFGATTAGMKRLNLPSEVIAYHKAHISIDTRHSAAWYEKVLEHYSTCSKHVVRELSLGVVIRYNVALRYYKYMFEAMRRLS